MRPMLVRLQAILPTLHSSTLILLQLHKLSNLLLSIRFAHMRLYQIRPSSSYVSYIKLHSNRDARAGTRLPHVSRCSRPLSRLLLPPDV